jgi:hypothetical protein
VTKESALDKVNPFRDRNVSEQLDAWSAAVEMAVATLNKTLAEFKEFQEEGKSDAAYDRATIDGAGTPAAGADDR